MKQGAAASIQSLARRGASEIENSKVLHDGTYIKEMPA